jgi:DNA-directed RNA polymerase subunit RPC12/RpoP
VTPELQRWDTFLGKIRAQFDALVAEGTEGCLALLEQSDFDPIPMTNAWSGIRAELMALDSRVDTVWDQKVEATFREAGLADAEIDKQRARGRALQAQLRLEQEKREVDVFGAAGERLLAQAKAAMAKEFRCTQCGAQLAVPAQCFRSVHVRCEYCQSVNTYEPGTRVRQVEHFCSHHLSQKRAAAEWARMRAVEERRRQSRTDELPVLRELERATLDYWTAYFRARADLVPAFAKDLEKDIQGRMRPFRDEMAKNQVWKRG